MPLIVISISMFVLFLVQAYVYRMTWKKNLSVEVFFDQDSVNEGENVHIIESVDNNKWNSVISLKVNLNIDKHIRFLNQENTVLTDRSCHSEVFAMTPHSKVMRKMNCFCAKRGYYRIENVFLVSNDLFYTQRLTETVSQDAALYVYPGSVDQADFSIVAERILGQIFTRKQMLDDPFEFRGIRQYEPFDPMRSINWKLSAKVGDLRVNLYENTAEQEVRILLDVGCDMLLQQESLIEEAIRIASALAEKFIDCGIVTSLAANGVDVISGIPFSVMGGAGEHHEIAVKQGLARLAVGSGHAEIPMSQVLQREAEDMERSGKVMACILISSEADASVVSEWNRICSGRELNWWIMPVHRREEGYISEMQRSEVIYWRVPYGK